MDVEFEEIVEKKEKLKLNKPERYKVIMLNDDYTSMEFVVELLITLFNKSFDEALNIMLSIHNKGSGICGIYTYDIAECKVDQVKKSAKERGFPLRATMEKE